MTQTPSYQQSQGYKQLRRSRDNRMVGGVLAGMANYLGTDPVAIRVAFVVVAILTGGLALIAYPIMWIMMPEESEPAPPIWTDPTGTTGPPPTDPLR